jgi:hypothetical protein
VVELARTKYTGYNHQHLTEELNETEGMEIDRSTVRRIMLASGMASPRKRRPPKHRARRERYAQEGMLLQIDGSRHDWLEGRGPRLTLVAGIDDATGTVPFGLFRDEEDAAGYFLLMQGVLLAKGIPMAVYRDGHTIFEASARRMTLAEELSGRRDPTQFGRLLEELGVRSIPARSPQAKGRIERLWGTFQDRLVSELRKSGATSLPEADLVLSAFLPRFNSRFAVPASAQGSAYRALPEHLDPDRLFCFKYRRVVALDNTIRFGTDRLQLLPSCGRVSYVRAQVEVCEHLDGAVSVYYQGGLVASRQAPAEAPLLRARSGERAPARAIQATQGPSKEPAKRATRVGKPAADHPWRTTSLKGADGRVPCPGRLEAIG